MEKNMLITYREGSFNPVTRTYDPIDINILYDLRIKDAIIFDINRRTIYAQGLEFGNSKTFAYTYQGTELQGTDVAQNGITFLTGIVQDVDGSISYSYSTAYTTFHTSGHAKGSTQPYVITYAYIDNNGMLHYDYRDLTTTDAMSSKINPVTLTNSRSQDVITGLTQASDGKISYSITRINTTHSTDDGRYIASEPIDDNGLMVVTDVHLDADGNLTYSYTDLHIDQAAQAATLSYLENFDATTSSNASYMHSVSWIYKQNDPYNKVAFVHKDLATTSNDKAKATNPDTLATNVTLQNNTSYRFITNIAQRGDGKLSYTFSDVNTYHYTTPGSYYAVGPLDDIGIALLTDVNLNADGVLSYTYTYLHINQAAEAGTLSYLENQVIGNHIDCSYSVIWLYKNPETPYNKVTFQYKSLANRDVDASKGSDITISPTKRQVITNIEQAGDGKITYTYSDIDICTSTNDGSYIAVGPLDDIGIALLTDVNLNENGVLSYSYTYLHINQAAEAGTLSYLENQVIGDNVDCSYSVIWLYKNTDQPYNKVTFQYKSLANRDVDGVEDDSITLQNNTTYQVLTNIKQAGDGKISYTYAMLNTTHTYSGDNIDGPVYNVSISPNGHVSYTHENLTVNSGVYASTTYNKGVKIANATAPTTYTQVLSNIKQDSHGKISYTYVGLYTDPVNDYKYHEFSISEDGSMEEQNTNFVDVIRALSTTNSGNSTSHIVTAAYTTVPTKNYVDSLIQANDALRYCGTVTPGASGTFALTHNTIDSGNNVDPGHSSPDTSRGAVYKVSATGIIGDQRVSAGDMIISYMDNASTTTILGWDIINQNIDLRALSSKAQNGTVVLTNANLSNDGTLSYNYGSLNAVVKDQEHHSAEFVVDDSSQDILNDNKNGAKVVTDIKLAQNGLTTELSFTYTYLYANQGHHSSNGALGMCGDGLSTSHTNVITQVNLTSTGDFSYRYSPLDVLNSPTNVTTGTATTQNNKSVNLVLNDNAPKGFRVITDVNLEQINLKTKLSYAYTYIYSDQRHHTSNRTGTDTTGLIQGVNLSQSGDFTYAYLNMTVNDPSSSANVTLTNSTTQDVITNISQAANGKITATKKTINTTHSTLDGSYVGVGPLDDLGIELLTGVNLSADGVLSYSYTYLHINQAAEAGTLSYLENQVISNSIPCSYSMIWMYKNPETPYNKVTFQYKNLANRDVDAVKGSDIAISPTKRQVITNIRQEGDGKISYTYSDIDICTSTLDGSYVGVGPLDDLGIELLTGVNLNANGVLSYSYTYLHINQSAQAGTLSYLENQVISNAVPCSYSVVWLYKNPETPYNKVTFQYKDLANRDVDGAKVVVDKSSESATMTLNNANKYQVLTNIRQEGDGKIAYTYAYINSTDELVKVSNASSVSYLVGTSSVTSSGNQIVGLQHSANAAYMSQDGTLWTKYLYSGIAMFAGDVYAKEKLYVDKHALFNGPVTIGDGTNQDKLVIKTKAVDFNSTTAIGFDNLQALWGTL